MVRAKDCYAKYGQPAANNPWMTMWNVPAKYQINNFPAKLWCNKDLIGPLSKALDNLLLTGVIAELCTFDGCFNIRKVRGSETEMSLHSWGVAIDLNATTNALGAKPTFSAKFVKCFTDAGFDWGGNFTKKDGMHYQLSKI